MNNNTKHALEYDSTPWTLINNIMKSESSIFAVAKLLARENDYLDPSEVTGIADIIMSQCHAIERHCFDLLPCNDDEEADVERKLLNAQRVLDRANDLAKVQRERITAYEEDAATTGKAQ